jgi:hypothetical protein
MKRILLDENARLQYELNTCPICGGKHMFCTKDIDALRARIEVLTKALESSCDEQREMLWEASGVGHGCKRAIDAEAEVDRLQKVVEWACSLALPGNTVSELRRRAKEG